MRISFPCSLLTVLLLSFYPTNDAFTSPHRSRIINPTSSTSILHSKTDETPEQSNSESSTTDHAPCFDGVCASNPLPLTTTHPGGEATLRLGPSPGPTVWSFFGRLSQQNPSLANLGQGFPDWLPPQFALDSLVEAVMDSSKSPHQYTRTAGHVNLVKELARRYSAHMEREVDAMDEVAVTVGASQALYLSLQTLLKPGDEVILFEPFFDLYVNQVKLAGGTPVYVPLTFVPYSTSTITGGEWILDPAILNQKISSKTRAIILNSPHNPTGKVFTRSEMESIAAATVIAGPQCVVLTDEVYKFIIHSLPKENIEEENQPPKPNAIHCPGHTHFASLPGMWDRTITISSAGKTFSATGWQVGWCIGPSHLIAPIHQLLPYVQFCASTVMQEALARSLPRAEEPYEGFPTYYEYLKDKYTKKRNLLGNALQKAGFAIPDWETTPSGGFFIFARIGETIRNVIPSERIGVENDAAPGKKTRQDWALCQWMAEERGVLFIPSSPFFSKERVMEGGSDEFVRIAFCKMDETIEKAAEAFEKLSEEEEEMGLKKKEKEEEVQVR